VYAGNIFGSGWPDDSWCYSYRYPYPDHPNPKCERMKFIVRILVGIGGGLGFLIGCVSPLQFIFFHLKDERCN
jgi:hypothetical protein